MKDNLWRWTLGLAAGLCASAWFARQLERADADRLRTNSTLHTAVGDSYTPGSASSFEIERPGQPSWRFERRDGAWRLPALHDAYAEPGAVDALLGALLASRGPAVGSHPTDADRFGLGADKAIAVRVQANGTTHAIWLGGTAPGQRGNDAWVRSADNRILLLPANPRTALGEAAGSPLVDRRIVPQATVPGTLSVITWRGLDDLPLQRLEHRAIAPERQNRERGITHEWVGVFADRERVLPAAAGFAASLLDWQTQSFVPATTPPGRTVVTWQFGFDGSKGSPGTQLEVLAEIDDSGGVLRNRSTGHVARVAIDDLEGKVRALRTLAAGSQPAGK
jgi:hypothetical protein